MSHKWDDFGVSAAQAPKLASLCVSQRQHKAPAQMGHMLPGTAQGYPPIAWPQCATLLQEQTHLLFLDAFFRIQELSRAR